MIERKVPYQKTAFVCTNLRDGEAACGNSNRGENSGFKLVELLRDEVKKRGLKGKIRIAKSGCMDLCGAGPNIMIFDEKGDYTLLSKVTKEDIPQIVQKYISVLEKPKESGPNI